MELVPRASLIEMVRHRDEAIDLYRVAFGKIAEADEALKTAHKMTAHFSSSEHFGYEDSRNEEISAFRNAIQLPDASIFMRAAERLTDIQFWSWLIDRADLARLMDKEAKEKLRAQLRYEPERPRSRHELIDQAEINKSFPPVTVENVLATIEGFRAESGMIFRRGIANAFSKLDRRFKSHDGFKVGSRVIINRMMTEHGFWNHYSNHRDTLTDIERAFAVLDGKGDCTFTNSINAIESARPGGFKTSVIVAETDYFKIRVFHNGNAHLWMKRDDLVRKVNKLLAEYYGEVIGDGQQQDADPFESRKASLAKNYGFFPTPARLAQQVIENAYLAGLKGKAARILEPSAGSGAIASRCAPYGAVDCIEAHADRAAALKQAGIYRHVYCADFLQIGPETTGLYDRVVMNPPFDRERDIDHVTHAWKFVAPGGHLVSIMSAGTEYRETVKTKAFRALVEKHRGRFSDLPAGSFSSVGTNVNTIILSMGKTS